MPKPADYISHPADLVKAMKAHPKAFLKAGVPTVKSRTSHGVTSRYSEVRYELINPGEDYFCRGVDRRAFENLEEGHEIVYAEKGRWRLK